MVVMRNMAIRHKLVVITMITSTIALLLTGISYIVWDQITLREALVQSLKTQAEMLADSVKAALAFEDAGDAEKSLSAFHVQPSIVCALVHNKKGEVFAGYYSKKRPGGLPSPVHLRGKTDESDKRVLTVFQPVVLEGETIGTVYIQSDLNPMYAALKRDVNIIVAVMIFATLIAYLVSSRLQKIISEPILSLAQVARAVSDREDYSTRAVKKTNDELGLLIDAFNDMLGQIQRRDSELLDSKRQLEVRVEERTAELTVANKQLQKEIVERKRAETKLTSLLDEIKNVNKELQSFAYVVSHDLKAPLRGISTLAEWLASDYADKFDESGKEQIKLLLGRVERMHNLIDGILQYSRAGTAKEEKATVNLNELVKEVISMVAAPPNIEITVEGQLPVLECQQTRVMQIFQNLLSNAVKYIDKPKGQIKIGCMEEGDFWKFSVADNGPGIESKYFEKIFQLFQTLAPREESASAGSTGIGLTVVKKIVELYGGKVWLESEIGKGTTFFFTLPKQQEQETADHERLQANTVS